MNIQDLTVEVRNADLERIGQITASELPGFEAVLRFNNVGNWKLTLPADHYLASALRETGSGIIVTGPTGVILSGPMTSVVVNKTNDNPVGIIEVEGTDDSVILGERLAYPTPTTANVEAQTSAYDKRSGIASTVMCAYVNANIGPAAPVARRIPGLTIAPDPVAGSLIFGSARFDVLGQLLTSLGSVDGLGFDVLQQDTGLEFRVYSPQDKTGTVRMDIANDTLSSTKFSYAAPGATVAIVAGQGTEENRLFKQVTTAQSVSAETAWGRRIETFVDQRQTDVVDELQQAGLEKLAEDGLTKVSLQVTPSSELTMEYGVDWNLGDKVSVVVDDDELQAVVTAVAIRIETDGVYVGATVGKPEGVDYEARLNSRQVTTSQRLNDLERAEQIPSSDAGGDLTGTYPNPTLKSIITPGSYQRVEVDAKGRVVTASPYRRYAIRKNGALSVANNTAVEITGWTTVENFGGFSLSGGTITVANAGVYNITLALVWAGNTTGLRCAHIIFGDGRTYRTVVNPHPNNSALVTALVTLTSINVAAGETILLQGLQTSGGALNINTDTYFSIQSA